MARSPSIAAPALRLGRQLGEFLGTVVSDQGVCRESSRQVVVEPILQREKCVRRQLGTGTIPEMVSPDGLNVIEPHHALSEQRHRRLWQVEQVGVLVRSYALAHLLRVLVASVYGRAQ